jgi:hypothetical protein
MEERIAQDELISAITEALCALEGNALAELAELVLGGKITYNGDGLFTREAGGR